MPMPCECQAAGPAARLPGKLHTRPHAAELQMLISGGRQGLDIADMRAHVQYSGGYHEEHPVVLVGGAGLGLSSWGVWVPGMGWAS